MVQSWHGKALMTEIHSLVDGLRSEEIALLQERRIAADRNAQTVLRVIMVSDVLAFVLVVFATGAINQAFTRRKAAEWVLLQA